MRIPVLIIGGGLSGLSAACQLKKRGIPFRLLEKESRVGGLCRSRKRDGFTFDELPHIFFSRSRKLVAYFKRLMQSGFVTHESNIKVFSHRTWTGFPFQTNLHSLPPEVVRDCLLGFVRSRMAASRRRPPAGFKEWLEAKFGEGITRHFLFPYNRKLWRFALEDMTCDWAEEKLVVPSLDQVVEGALGVNQGRLGAHARFYYPRRGGIEALPRALLSKLKPETVSTGVEVTRIRAGDNVASTRRGEEIEYERLISTIPLPGQVKLMKDVPARVRSAARNLHSNGVVAFQVAVRRSRCADMHWAYFAQRDLPFYRVMQQSELAGGLCPRGWSTLICEVSFSGGNRPDVKALRPRVISGLREIGLLRTGDEYLVAGNYLCDPAYVIYDKDRKKNVSLIKNYLSRSGILTAGRYGSWEYLNMDGCLESGRLAADTINI